MRQIFFEENFHKKFKSFIKLHPDVTSKVKKVIGYLEQDVFLPRLKSHKLTGNLLEFYSCSINLKYRIIFRFDDGCVYLINIGDHDDVY